MHKYILTAVLIFCSQGILSQQNDLALATNDTIKEIDNDSVKKKKSRILDEITVKAQKNKKIVNAGKTNIKPIDLPQATAVIGKETIEQQQLLRLSEVVKNTNGVYVAGASNASGNNQEELGSRGFSFSGNNTFRNGVRINGSLIPEANSLESIEVLKGSSALLYGNVAPGGILNLITKKPKFNQGGEISFRVSDYAFYKPTVDIYGSVDNSNSVAYRLITSYEKGNSFRDKVQSERTFINPSILAYLTDKTSLLIEADYTKDFRTPDFGLAAINYEIVELPINTFLNYDWAKFETKQIGTTATLTHNINDNWQAKAVASYQGYNNELLSSTRPNSGNINPFNTDPSIKNNVVKTNGDWYRGVQKNKTNQDYALTEIDLNGKFSTGTIKHSLLIGSDADRTSTNVINYKNITYFDKINIFNPNVIIEKHKDANVNYTNTSIPDMTAKNTTVDTQIKRASIYIQDFIELTPYLKALAGIRYNYLESNIRTINHKADNSINTDKTDKTNNNILTSKLGIVIQPTKQNSIFASYADSFTLNTGTDRFGNALPPSFLDQYEVGIKNEFLDGHLTANATAYLINNDNVAQTDFSNGNTNTNIKELTGSQTTKGFELDITGNYKGFKALAGYSFTESKVSKSNTFEVGTMLRFYPKHTANASLFYTFNKTFFKGLEIGFMSSYVGERFGGRLRPMNATPGSVEASRRLIPMTEFTMFDASLGYTYKSIAIRAKLSNVTNVVNYYVYDDNTVTPLTPRMITTTVSYKF
jgi:iron complex outermembrane recepter protein